MSANSERVSEMTMRRLTQTEIDRRIEGVAAEVAARMEYGIIEDLGLGGAGPRWIAPAELVRRMRPFMGMN